MNAAFYENWEAANSLAGHAPNATMTRHENHKAKSWVLHCTAGGGCAIACHSIIKTMLAMTGMKKYHAESRFLSRMYFASPGASR